MKTLTLEECLALLDRAPYQPIDWYKVHGKRPAVRPSATANQWATTETTLRLAAVDKIVATLRGWLARGDGIAVYRNEAFDSAACGQRKFNPWYKDETEPPTRLPDTSTAINWAYTLEAVVPCAGK